MASPPFTGYLGPRLGSIDPRSHSLGSPVSNPSSSPPPQNSSPQLENCISGHSKIELEGNGALSRHCKRTREHWARTHQQGWLETKKRWFPMCQDLGKSSGVRSQTSLGQSMNLPHPRPHTRQACRHGRGKGCHFE